MSSRDQTLEVEKSENQPVCRTYIIRYHSVASTAPIFLVSDNPNLEF